MMKPFRQKRTCHFLQSVTSPAHPHALFRFQGQYPPHSLPDYIPAVPPFSLQEPSTGGNSCIPVKCSAGNMFFHMNSGKEASFSLTGKDFCHTTAVFDNLRTIANIDLFRKEQRQPIYHRQQMSPCRFFPQRHGQAEYLTAMLTQLHENPALKTNKPRRITSPGLLFN